MKTGNINELSDKQLLRNLKTLKINKITDAILVGITVGIAVYGAVKNGFGFFTFFPLILAYLFVRKSKNNKMLEKEMQKELESRNV